MLQKKYSFVNQMIKTEKLFGIHAKRPLLDGQDICTLYEIKAGKSIKFLLEEVVKYQILHPESAY